MNLLFEATVQAEEAIINALVGGPSRTTPPHQQQQHVN